ncbi:MAG: anti-sigma factor, partial [Anaerolineae bacterium]|nr:anti-sigma factor [Anaerolineae bacterium]
MSQQPQQPDCETLRALIPVYSLGATDPDETALVERLLPLCPEVAAELDEFQALSQAMLYAAPVSQPPAHLHDRLLAAAGAPAQPAASVPAAVPAKPTPSLRVLRFNRITAGIAAVAAALLVISNIYWINQVSTLNRQQQDMIALLGDQQDALASLGSGRAERLELVSTSGDQNGVLATVLWNPQSDTALLYSDTLPALP